MKSITLFILLVALWGCEHGNPSSCKNGESLEALGKIALKYAEKYEVPFFSYDELNAGGYSIGDPEILIVRDTIWEDNLEQSDTIRIRYYYQNVATGERSIFSGVVDFVKGNCTPVFVKSGKMLFEGNIPNIEWIAERECSKIMNEAEREKCIEVTRKAQGGDFSWSDFQLSHRDSIEVANLIRCCMKTWD